MEIFRKTLGDVEVVRPCGRMDAISSTEVEARLNDLVEAAHFRLVVSLEELEYISSSGLRVFLAALKKVRQQKGDLRLAGLREQVKEVFDLAGFTSLFTIVENESAAIESYQKSIFRQPVNTKARGNQ